MLPIDGDTLRAIAPKFSGQKAADQAAIVQAVGPALRATLAGYGIDTRLRIAHFLAQVAHESAGLRTCEEFASGAAYEGRQDLGNTQAGDGVRYKGRGLIQLTGRANYKKFGDRMGADLVKTPAKAAEPVFSLRIACEYWKDRKINAHADNDDLRAVTKAINGGYNGLEDRSAYLAKAKAELARLEALAIAAAAPADARPVLRRGNRDAAVGELQTALRAKGHPIAIDGDFGAATELAVMSFQAKKKLTADGIVGPATWKALGL